VQRGGGGGGGGAGAYILIFRFCSGGAGNLGGNLSDGVCSTAKQAAAGVWGKVGNGVTAKSPGNFEKFVKILISITLLSFNPVSI
jgi:hypothetical protein